jgi:8-oxo-dGTP pyrophosphatase MutT (NUDIX family)
MSFEAPAFFERLSWSLTNRRSESIETGSLRLKEAAVLVPLFCEGDGLHALLTKRPLSLRKHPGQISFPGGKRDDEDATLLHTALRESEEEIGLARTHVTILGQLGALPTVTAFYVTPFVAHISQTTFHPNRDEIDEVMFAPLFQLRREKRLILAVERDVYVWGDARHVVWGATFRMLNQLMTHVDTVRGV